jgi:Ribonuclease G/E
MSARALYMDRAVGETRGVVTLDGRPERLLIRRDGEEERLRCGALLVARVRRVEAALASAFLDLGGGAEAVLPFRPEARPVEGQAVAVEIRSEPRPGKLAVVRLDGPAEGAPRLLRPPPPIAEQLSAIARGVPVVEGRQAREVADQAQAEALAVVHPLPGGGDIAIETTRALTTVDVDAGERKGADFKRVTRQLNLAALAAGARLLRLKSLGGLVVFDLTGRGHDGAAMLAAARTAFGPDNPGVALGPISRFGTLEMTIPRRTPPVREILCDPDGTLSDRSLALALVRRIEDEAAAQPGARLAARCAPAVASAARDLAGALADRIGARFVLQGEASFGRDRMEVSAT